MRKGLQTIQKTNQQVLAQMDRNSLMRSTNTVQPKRQSCPLCNDLGWLGQDLPVTHPDFGRMIRCGCKAVDDSERLRTVTGLTPEEMTVSFGDILTAGHSGTLEMVNACKALIYSPGGILTIWGTSGNGKSMVLPAAMNDVLARNIPAVYVSAFDLINWIRKAYSELDRNVKDQDAYSRLLRFEQVPFLALDEVDKIFPLSNWEAKQVTDLIDKRYRWGMADRMWTVLTMNQNPFVLFDEFPHILSRLKDGRNMIVQNLDEDMRPGLRRL